MKLWHAVTATLLVAVPAAAQDTQLASLYDKWQVTTSLTSVILNSDIRIDATDGSFGTTIDAEDDLGLQTVKLQPRFDGRLRLGRRHEIEAGYQFARRSGDNTLQRDLSFADTTFYAGADIHALMNSDLLFVNYRYALVAKERTQFGVGVGLGALFFKTDLEALGTGSQEVDYSATVKATPPVGSLGLFGRFLMGTRWMSEADVRFVTLKIDRFDVRYWEANGGVRYFFSKKWGTELGYGLDAVTVDVDPRTKRSGDEGRFGGQIKFSLQNARLGVVFVP